MRDVPEELIRAQEFQKAGDYLLSMRLYRRFFEENIGHELRFKALFEVADNYYHARKYTEAKQAYIYFLEYCSNQKTITLEEQKWIDAYVTLTHSRIKSIHSVL